MEHNPLVRGKKGPCGPCVNCSWCGCTCAGCKIALRDRERLYNRPDTSWNNPLLPTDGVIAHMKELELQGIGSHTLGKLTGLSVSSLCRIRRGATNKIRKQNQDKIFAVTYSSEWVGYPTLAQKKIISLNLDGVPMVRIAEHTGIGLSTIKKIKRGEKKKTSLEIYNKIMGLKASDFPSPSRHVTSTARKRYANQI